MSDLEFYCITGTILINVFYTLYLHIKLSDCYGRVERLKSATDLLVYEMEVPDTPVGSRYYVYTKRPDKDLIKLKAIVAEVTNHVYRSNK